MNLNIPLKNVPIISIKDFHKFTKYQKDKIIKNLLGIKDLWDNQPNSNKSTTNFEILYNKDDKKYNNLINDLYDKFYRVAQQLFNFTVSKKSKRICWACITNKEYYNFVPHNHIKSSTINAVYYLNIPRINKKLSGPVKFKVDNKWIYYQPDNNELILFPNYLIHDATKHNSKEWRVSINMEILCREDKDYIVHVLDKNNKM